jgi:HD-GYP domain-containing protein (c-di-GMP phosphodiesterase class II)
MFVKKEIALFDFVSSLSDIVDLVSPARNSHHKKVAYIACNIALEMNLPANGIQDIVLAAMLHDIGAFSLGEKIKMLAFELQENESYQHAFLGYKLLKGFKPLTDAATLIRYHHMDFNPSRHDIPVGSYIIHLADRVSILFDDNCEILEQIPEIIQKIMPSYRKFHPDVFAAFYRLTKLEYIWIEASLPSFGTVLMKKICCSKDIIDLETLRSFAQIIAQMIDFRSKFTATHSSGVAAVARELTGISGFSDRECKQMEIAGLLHDLGKLAVPNDILEKNGTLCKEEFNEIKKHTYYTYAVLSRVNGLEDIASLAAYHHERQDGTGYPFHVQGGDFSRPARFMVVADIVTALTEDRPYRPGMDREQASEVLFSLAENGGVDKGIAELAYKNFFRINDARIKAQQEARNEYNVFHNTDFPFIVKNAISA